MSQEIKTHLNTLCIAITQKRISEIKIALELSQESLVSDTKSSAGDKYETSREVIQQDISRFNSQLRLATEDLNILNNVDVNAKKMVGIGSLIETNQGFFYITVGIGKVEMDENVYYVISPNAPMAKHFLGKKSKEEIVFNQKQFLIKNIH